MVCLDSVLPGPLPGHGLVPGPVGLVDMGDLRDEGIVGVGIGQHRADRQQDLGDGKSGRPLIPQDIQANTTVGVDVGVVNPGGEVHLRRLERIVCGEGDAKEKDTGRIGTVGGSHDSSLPVEKIITDGASGAGAGGITSEISELLVNALEGHFIEGDGFESLV